MKRPLLALILALAWCDAGAATYIVAGGTPTPGVQFNTIAEAVSACAASGDTVSIRASYSTTDESVIVIGKNFYVYGENGNLVKSNPTPGVAQPNVLYFSNCGVTLNGVNFENGRVVGSEDSTVLCKRSTHSLSVSMSGSVFCFQNVNLRNSICKCSVSGATRAWIPTTSDIRYAENITATGFNAAFRTQVPFSAVNCLFYGNSAYDVQATDSSSVSMVSYSSAQTITGWGTGCVQIPAFTPFYSPSPSNAWDFIPRWGPWCFSGVEIAGVTDQPGLLGWYNTVPTKPTMGAIPYIGHFWEEEE